MRIWIILAGVMGVQAVISGALSAHMDLSARGHVLIDKAVQYEMWHALVLIGVGILSTEKSRLLNACGVFFALGVSLFCGTLYLKGFWGLSPFPLSAPLGGICLILGWVCLSAFGFRRGQQQLVE